MSNLGEEDLAIPFVFSTGYSGHHMRDGYSDRPVLKKPFM
jgi:hypothetical protein